MTFGSELHSICCMCCARTYDDGPVRARNHMLGACPMSVFDGACARSDEVVARWIQNVGLYVIDTMENILQ